MQLLLLLWWPHDLRPVVQEIQAAEAMAAQQAEEVRRLQGELQEARRNGT